jgi:gluconate 5-dehydrogenase
MFDLRGKTALVTGGSYGLGPMFAEALAGAGADVALTARSAERLESVRAGIEAMGVKATAYPGDVTVEADVMRIVADTIADHGKLDVLVNNAGISDDRGLPSELFDTETFRKILDCDVTGLFMFAREAGKHMLERGSGSIINIASILGDGGSEGVTPAYYAAKGAVINLTKLLAVEWGDRGVRVNALSPNFFVSEMTRDFLVEAGTDIWWESRTPMRRLGEPEDLSGPVVFLASDASLYVTGLNLAVDGGFGAGRGAPQERPPFLKYNERQGIAQIGTPYPGLSKVREARRQAREASKAAGADAAGGDVAPGQPVN